MEDSIKNDQTSQTKKSFGCLLVFFILCVPIPVVFWAPSLYTYPEYTKERKIRSTAKKFYNHSIAYFADDTHAHPNGKIYVGPHGPPGFEADSGVTIIGGPMVEVGGHVYFKQPLLFTHKDYSLTFLLHPNGDLEEFPVGSFAKIEEHPGYKILVQVYHMKNRIMEDHTAVDFNAQDIVFLVSAAENVDIRAIREGAAWVLGEIQTERAVKILIKELNYGGARESAASALGKLKDPRAVEPLVHMIQDSEDVPANRAAIYALGEIKDPRAVEPLIELQKDKNADGISRDMAKDALEKITRLKLGRQSDSAELKSWIRQQRGKPEENEPVSIIGAWTLSVADKSCLETTEYHSDRTLRIKRNQEIIEGDYIFYKARYGGIRYKLTLSYTFDNGLPDCNGNAVDETGQVTDWHVEFFDAGKKMYLFNKPAQSDFALGPFSKTE